jgi:hypothetical protein
MMPNRFVIRHSSIQFGLTCAALVAGLATRASAELPLRWLYLSTNLQVNENVPKAEALLRRAAKAGYDGVLLADYKLNILDRVPDHYFKNAQQLKATAGELKIEIIPGVAPFGYSEGILAHDPNLAEGLPARDVPLRVVGDHAELDSLLGNALPGGAFDEHKNNKFIGWDFQDEPGKLSFADIGVKPDQDWTEHHIVFNSLDNDEVRFYVGAWTARSGKLWLDDARLEETAFVNLLRRPGCPLKVVDASGTVYSEGNDFAELRDTKMGSTPWTGSFDVYHEPPKLMIPPRSRIKQGKKLRVSFFHAVTIYDNQVPCSLAEPRVFEVLHDQVQRVEDLFHPKTYMLSHDEIRVANWTDDEFRSDRSAGELLADNVRRCVAVVRGINPSARLCFWSDMFDPHHNAVKDFYLVNGDLAGSWEGLPKDAIIVNWNSGKARESLPFFANRGHKQVLAGYYDGRAEAIRTWLDAGRGLLGIDGAMYTTWQQNYNQLEAFAVYAWRAKAIGPGR